MNFKSKYGEYALVTGATSGIGKALAFQLAAKGLHIIQVARNGNELEECATELKNQFSIDVVSISADLSTSEGVEKLIASTANYAVGLFVPAAGMEVNGSFEKNAIEKELLVLQLNVVSLVQLTHHYLQKMVANKKGGLLFVASLSGHMPNPYFANYAGSKAFMLNFGASLYGELKPKGIDVAILSPGLTKTPMVANNGVNWSKTPMTAMLPSDVAQTGIAALGKKLIAVPSFKNKMMAFLSKHSPLEMQSKMNEKMMRKAIDSNKI